MNRKLKLNLKILKLNDLNKLRSFISKNWKKNHILSKNKKFLIWQHYSNNNLNTAAATIKNKIIGLQMFIPQNHYDAALSKKEISLTIFRCIKSTIPGLSVKIFKFNMSKIKPRFVGTTGFSHDMINFHKWQGFKIGLMKHHVAISPFKKKFLISKIPKNIKKIKLINQTNIYKLIKLNNKNKKFFKNSKIYKNQIPRKSLNFIYKRYVNHVSYKYLIYGLSYKKEIISICVLRIIKKRNNSVIKIVDYIGKDQFLKRYNNLFVDLLKINSAEYIDFYSYGIKEKFILDAGLINRRKFKGLVIPEYFEPFVKKNINLMYGYINKTNSKVKIFKGDGDRDRPNYLF